MNNKYYNNNSVSLDICKKINKLETISGSDTIEYKINDKIYKTSDSYKWFGFDATTGKNNNIDIESVQIIENKDKPFGCFFEGKSNLF